MKFNIIFAITVILGACSINVQNEPVSIVPCPNHMQVQEGKFHLTRACGIFIDQNTEEFNRIAFFLNKRLKAAAGFELKCTAERFSLFEPGIYFMNADLPPEAYSVRVEATRIIIEYGDGAGAFYGLQTLFQLLPVEIFSNKINRKVKWTVPCCHIEDEPRFKYRGMHLDVCLHFFSLDFLKKYIDIMALHKVNRFHWHLTEDQGWRIEIKKYPLLTEKGQWRKETVVGSLASGIYDGIPHGGYYSQEQIKELVRYAAERYVTIIPEIEMPGHALAALACYPELSCGLEDTYETATRWGVFKQVYCSKEETFIFLENVLEEVMELFPSKLVHIGGDECPKDSWKKCLACQNLIRKLGLKDEYELQSWFIARIGKYINSKGYDIIGWEEILQGGLAPNAKVMSWLGEEGGIKAAKINHEVVMAPHNKYYLDYWQADPDSEPLAMGGPVTLRSVYEYNPVPESLEPDYRKFIIGVEGCLWTEYISSAEHAEYMAWPRMCAIAETGWSDREKEWDGFTRRLEKHLQRLKALDVRYCEAFFNPYIVFHKDTPANRVVTISVDAPDAKIHYTLDGSVPDAESPEYTCPFSINKSQTVSAVAIRDGKPIGQIKTKSIK